MQPLLTVDGPDLLEDPFGAGEPAAAGLDLPFYPTEAEQVGRIGPQPFPQSAFEEELTGLAELAGVYERIQEGLLADRDELRALSANWSIQGSDQVRIAGLTVPPPRSFAPLRMTWYGCEG